MSKQPPPAPTASAVGPCPTVIKIVGRPGTESLPSTIAPPDHPSSIRSAQKSADHVLFSLTVLCYSLGNIRFIGVGRFRILGGWGVGGQGLEYGGGGKVGGANSQPAHNVVTTSFRRHVPTRFLINQCQIITFLILKSDIIENSRIKLRGIVLLSPSNQIKVTFIIILFFNLVHLFCFFFMFQIEIEEKGEWIIGGQRVCCPPPTSDFWGACTPPPPAHPPLFVRLCVFDILVQG